MSDGYQGALAAAGATIHEFKEFGSYQGEWFAHAPGRTLDDVLALLAPRP